MIYKVLRALGREQALRFANELSGRMFQDGRSTARGLARDVKNNLQFRAAAPQDDAISSALTRALEQNPQISAFAMPRRMVPLMFNRYEPGMRYGRHLDDVLMGGFNGVRTDFSLTVFLSTPASYDGGELVVEGPDGEHVFKLDAGEAVLYPANLIHRVEPVTRGVRIAAVTWLQSGVRDETMRDVLRNLADIRARIDALGDKQLSLTLAKTYQDLLRHAAE